MSEPVDFMQQMQDMLEAVQSAQDNLDEIEVIGTSGGGAVRVVASALPEIKRVDISDEALEDREMLGDLVVVAVNDALQKAAEAMQQQLGGFAGGLQLPGLSFPGLEAADDDSEDDDDE